VNIHWIFSRFVLRRRFQISISDSNSARFSMRRFRHIVRSTPIAIFACSAEESSSYDRLVITRVVGVTTRIKGVKSFAIVHGKRPSLPNALGQVRVRYELATERHRIENSFSDCASRGFRLKQEGLENDNSKEEYGNLQSDQYRTRWRITEAASAGTICPRIAEQAQSKDG
jgi:hypothetical protein